ncbi:MAG: polyprenyl synthetase family protein [Mariprofundaceae bacterium]
MLNQSLEQMLAARKSVIPKQLWSAMHYCLTAGGKRIRPALMLECHAACGGKNTDIVLPAAMSIECMHTYSLIHDDLPCMDDDDLRRGNLTCHRQFDEATAILTADALQAMSFELLGEGNLSDEMQAALCHKLALAAGAQGMVGGQMLDMLAEDQQPDSVLEVERIHVHKTGELLCYCCNAGALLANASATQQEACCRYGKAVGLLFQIADDILDATASSEALGKSAGKDATQHKATYVSVLGLEHARELADDTLDIAIESLAPLGDSGKPLHDLACYIRNRSQ